MNTEMQVNSIGELGGGGAQIKARERSIEMYDIEMRGKDRF